MKLLKSELTSSKGFGWLLDCDTSLCRSSTILYGSEMPHLTGNIDRVCVNIRHLSTVDGFVRSLNIAASLKSLAYSEVFCTVKIITP